MKELERPWVHWHSSMSPDLMECLNPTSPLAQNPIMTFAGKADDMEIIVVHGIKKWHVFHVLWYRGAFH